MNTNEKKEYNKKYRSKPGYKAKAKAYRQKPENKAKQKKREQSIEYKEKAKIYRRKPETKAIKMKSVWKSNGIKDMTMERYEIMLKEQKGNCAICGLNEKEFKKKLAVDHDHETGKVRGLLCQKCNQAIGLLDENIDIIASAISYLQQEAITNE